MLSKFGSRKVTDLLDLEPAICYQQHVEWLHLFFGFTPSGGAKQWFGMGILQILERCRQGQQTLLAFFFCQVHIPAPANIF